MRGFMRFAVLALVCVLFAPAMARAQGASIAGVVKDTSGAVLPGVTVEAASPVLIEKTRAAVTDGSGQYKIINLLPGHLHGDVHADRVQHREARWRRGDGHVDGERSTPR